VLWCDEGEFVAKFQQKFFEMLDQGLFQFTFRVFILEAEEFEQQWVANFLIGGDCILWFVLFALQQHRRFIPGQGCPLVKLCPDLPVKLAH